MSLSAEEAVALRDIATKLRIHAVESTTAAGSGHPTSCSSMAEIISVLFFNVMKYDVKEPKSASNDRFILSKGHAAPILYAAWAEAGLFPVSDLLKLRTLESDLEGHPTPRLNFIDVATGSLGQGLSIACGMAYCGKYLDKAAYRTYCLMGDGESMEGNVWEAMTFAGYYKLDNLCAIIDVNRLGQSDPTPLQHDTDVYKKRVESFGFHGIVVDGHNVVQVVKALKEAQEIKDKPTCILAKTFKGKDFPDIADKMSWHGKAIGTQTEEVVKHLRSLLQHPDATNPKPPTPISAAPEVNITNIHLSASPAYKLGQAVATRQAYGNALVKICDNNPRVISLDGDMKNSTYSEKVRNKYSERHVECFIMEQNLTGVGIGLACRDRCVSFISTFACFFARSFDNLRMGVISQTNLNVAGSHCGVSIGEDGPSQMALEDIAMFRSLPGSTVFYPSDAVSTERAVQIAANTKGICFIRLSRPATPVVYANDEKFEAGKAKVLRQSGSDKALVIGAGVTLEEALNAAKDLESFSGISIRVMDPFTIKPLDEVGIIRNALECGGRIITVEDHYPEGGLGSAVADAVAGRRDIVLKKLAVREVPRSGPPKILIQKYEIGAKSIIKAVQEIVKI